MVIALALSMARSFPARAEDLVGGWCPRKIKVAEQRLAEDVPGWQVMLDDVTHLLANVSFTEGHPSKQTPVHPDNDAGPKAKKLSYTLDRTSPSHWIVCEYLGTSVLLVRELDPKFRRCDLSLNPDVHIGGWPEVRDIRCR